MTSSVLLTGGFGNIGGRFAAFLTEEHDAHIKLATRRNRPAPRWASTADVSICDLTNLGSLKRACEGVSTIFHFAALNDRECASDPDRAQLVNVKGTENLLQAALSTGVDHVVYMSTIHVYGAPLVGHIDESSDTCPTHPYGVTHLAAEQILSGSSNQIKSTIVRSGNGFGYPMSFDVDIWHIIANDLCIQAVRDRKLILKSSANSQRNFVTLRDICRALYFVGMAQPTSESSITYNLGSRMSRTLREIANLVAHRCSQLFGYRPEIVESVPETPTNTSLQFDCSRLWQTGFSTEELFDDEIDGTLRLVAANLG
jgi:UDP-glucose 4-epimerase